VRSLFGMDLVPCPSPGRAQIVPRFPKRLRLRIQAARSLGSLRYQGQRSDDLGKYLHFCSPAAGYRRSLQFPWSSACSLSVPCEGPARLNDAIAIAATDGIRLASVASPPGSFQDTLACSMPPSLTVGRIANAGNSRANGQTKRDLAGPAESKDQIPDGCPCLRKSRRSRAPWCDCLGCLVRTYKGTQRDQLYPPRAPGQAATKFLYGQEELRAREMALPYIR